MRERSIPRRRLLALLASLAALTALAVGTGAAFQPAAAQTGRTASPIDVQVLRISPFNDPTIPLHLELSLHNNGPVAVEDGRVQVRIYSKVGSRSELRAALNGRPHEDVRYLTADDIDPLQASEERTITFDRELGKLSNAFRKGRASSSGVYPLQIRVEGLGRELWTGWGAMIFFSSAPRERLNVTWVVPVHTSAMVDAEGPQGGTNGKALSVFYPGRTVDRAVGLEGSLVALSAAFDELSTLGATFAPTPLMLDELADIKDGYHRHDRSRKIDTGPADAVPRGAGVVLSRLKKAVSVSTTEVATVPYSRADLVSLVHAGLEDDAAEQLRLGVATDAKHLGKKPNARLLVPAGLTLDERAVAAVVKLGIREVVLDASTLPEQPGPYGPTRPIRIEGAGGARATALLADPPILERLGTDATPDPILRAQAVLAETASSWFELPSLASQRSVVIASRDTPSTATVDALASGLAAAPWVGMRSASSLVATLPADPTPQRIAIGTVTAPGALDEVRSARHAIDVLRRVIVEPATPIVSTPPEPAGTPGSLGSLGSVRSPAPLEPLERFVLAAESADWQDGHGIDLARAAKSRAETILRGISAASRQVTLTSRTGKLPVTILNKTIYTVRVLLRLSSAKVAFPDGADRTIEVDGNPATVTVSAKARAAGAFGVNVELRTPDDAFAIGNDELVVRSTAVSAVALIAMGGGLLVLLAAWVRRGGHKKGGKRPAAAPDGAPHPA